MICDSKFRINGNFKHYNTCDGRSKIIDSLIKVVGINIYFDNCMLNDCGLYNSKVLYTL